MDSLLRDGRTRPQSGAWKAEGAGASLKAIPVMAHGSTTYDMPVEDSGTAGAFEHIGPVQGFEGSGAPASSGIALACTRCSKWAAERAGWSHPARAEPDEASDMAQSVNNAPATVLAHCLETPTFMIAPGRDDSRIACKKRGDAFEDPRISIDKGNPGN